MRYFVGFALIALAAVQGTPASAGVYSDDLAKCMVSKTTDADKITLVRWMFAAMSASPATKDMTSLSAEQRLEHHKKAGALFTRLITADCHTESINVLKYEGQAAFTSSFEVLGTVAVRNLMNDPAVEHDMEGLSQGFDLPKLKALFGEAGLPTKD